LICLLALAVILVAGVGVTYGRYLSTVRDTVIFQAEQSDPARAITIQSDGWRTTVSSAELSFSLKSGAEGQKATLRLTATEGFDPDNATVTLTVDGTAYVGVPQSVEEGHPLFDKMGKGTEYRFYTAEGECEWAVSSATYTLKVEGNAEASLLRLTATEA
jgi:hypothetical protein